MASVACRNQGDSCMVCSHAVLAQWMTSPVALVQTLGLPAPAAKQPAHHALLQPGAP
jgi:hypothetical protein